MGIEIEEKTAVSLPSIDFKNDELTMIVGPEASGKSSYINALSRSLHPSEGKNPRIRQIRKIISVVFWVRHLGYLILQ